MKREEEIFIRQVIKSLRDSAENIDNYYKRNDSVNFNKTKKLILNIQEKILEFAEQ